MSQSSTEVLPRVPGLGESQRRILDTLKRDGPRTLAEIGDDLHLARETIREHLNALAAKALIARTGRRRSGPGRPEIVYSLTEAGESLFPRTEDRLLQELASFLVARGREDLLRTFLEDRVARRRSEVASRLDGLEGVARFEVVAEILTEDGFMARVEEEDAERGELTLRLCNCPIRGLVSASHLPCQVEIAFVEELLGQPLARGEYMPQGDRSCSYGLPCGSEE